MVSYCIHLLIFGNDRQYTFSAPQPGDPVPLIGQKVHFLPQSRLKVWFYEGSQVQKVHFLGFRTPFPPQKSRIWLRAWPFLFLSGCFYMNGHITTHETTHVLQCTTTLCQFLWNPPLMEQLHLNYRSNIFVLKFILANPAKDSSDISLTTCHFIRLAMKKGH